MRKTLVFILFLVFTSLSSFSQIQRSFFDFTLCTTTKKEVIKYFKSKGIKTEKHDDKTYSVKNVEFGGHKWPFVAFCFYKDKLYMVYFSDSEERTSKELLDLVWNNLDSKLFSKYTEYYKDYLSNSTEKVYDDNTTKLTLDHNMFKGYLFVTLKYMDKNLDWERYKGDSDEL